MVEDYGIKVRNGKAEPTGEYIERNGRKKPVLKDTERYQTAAGLFKPEEWKRKAMEAIKADGKLELLEKIKEHCRENLGWLRTEDEIEEYTIDCLCKGAYKYWKNFEEE